MVIYMELKIKDTKRIETIKVEFMPTWTFDIIGERDYRPVEIDLNPSSFTEGGVNSTGFLNLDIKNYVHSILSKLFETYIFDFDEEHHNRLLKDKFYGLPREAYISHSGFIKEILKGDLRLLGQVNEYGFSLSRVKLDFEVGLINKSDLFSMLFGRKVYEKNKNVPSDCTVKWAGSSKEMISLELPYRDYCCNIEQLINALYKIFINYQFVVARDLSFATILSEYNKLVNKDSLITIFDYNIKQYFPLYSYKSLLLNKTSSNLSKSIKCKNLKMNYKRVKVNSKDLNKIKLKDENSPVIAKNYSNSVEPIHSKYRIYKLVDETIYEVSLSFEYINKDIGNLINCYIITLEPFSNSDCNINVSYKELVSGDSNILSLLNNKLKVNMKICKYKDNYKSDYINRSYLDYSNINLYNKKDRTVFSELIKTLELELDLKEILLKGDYNENIIFN